MLCGASGAASLGAPEGGVGWDLPASAASEHPAPTVLCLPGTGTSACMRRLQCRQVPRGVAARDTVSGMVAYFGSAAPARPPPRRTSGTEQNPMPIRRLLYYSQLGAPSPRGPRARPDTLDTFQAAKGREKRKRKQKAGNKSLARCAAQRRCVRITRPQLLPITTAETCLFPRPTPPPPPAPSVFSFSLFSFSFFPVRGIISAIDFIRII